MDRKYIILRNGQPILFSGVLSHVDMAHAHGGRPYVKSAGFWNTDGKQYSCFGKSTTLNLKSDPVEDSQILTRYFGEGFL